MDDMTTREHTRAVRIGNVAVGGGNPVAVQSMTNADTRDVDATIKQILALEEAGCEIARAAVPDEESARAFKRIKDGIHIPLVADIHFSAKLAVLAVENGADKLRINPGNIGGGDKVKLVADAARAHHVPIRVGVNAGSLEKDLLDKHGVTARALADSALGQVRLLERFGFTDIVVAVKASDVRLSLDAYRIVAETAGYPLHIGVTEAGFGNNGLIKSAVGLGALLLDGLGDTLRVSLSGEPVQEVYAAYSILRAAGVRRRGVEIISCPTCARTGIDVEGLAREAERRTAGIRKPLKVAVMGCVVNGPGEAREADLGIAGGQGAGALFARGEPARSIPEEGLLEALMEAVERVTGEKTII
jgi:(E)-4-hydroxy-3-methylbut-2-enyl-diphosphate synthase